MCRWRQGMLRRMASKGRDSDEYRKAMEKRTALATAMIALMDDQNLDALV